MKFELHASLTPSSLPRGEQRKWGLHSSGFLFQG
jgi:hypothetical protein